MGTNFYWKRGALIETIADLDPFLDDEEKSQVTADTFHIWQKLVREARLRRDTWTLPTGVKVNEDGYDGDLGRDDPRIHIGKRSAAGLYCYDCNVTLCQQGEAVIHHGYAAFHEKCPKCGKGRVEVDPLTKGSVAVELGFAQPERERPKGVVTCSSFGWAQDPIVAKAACERVHYANKIVVDEYGREMTGMEFLTMLRCNCPINFMHIGESFS